MSFREKSAWISLLTLAGVAGWYFWTLARISQAGLEEARGYMEPLVESIVILVIVQIVLTAIVAARRPKEAEAAEDEREKLINLKAARFGFYVLTIAVLSAAGYMAMNDVSEFYAVNAVYLAVVLGEAARNLAQIVYFRLGA